MTGSNIFETGVSLTLASVLRFCFVSTDIPHNSIRVPLLGELVIWIPSASA
jgi:hypothetical protein